MTVETEPVKSVKLGGRADECRLKRFIDAVVAISMESDGGCSRLAFTLAEREAHGYFAAEARQLGMSVQVDAIGNSFAWLGEGKEPALAVGSHLDTVPRGGRFDGLAGVAASLEVARLLVEATGGDHPGFCAIAFAAEEGARFGVPCIGSRVATGALLAGNLMTIKDGDGISIFDAALAVGLKPAVAGDEVLRTNALRGYIELHIEQGAVLESRGKVIGLVDTVAGSTRLLVRFHGRADHSGATPMSLRRDALAAAGELVVEVERAAKLRPTSVATVGRLDVMPNSLTTVPGEATLAIDIRDVDTERQRALADAVLDGAIRIGQRRMLGLSAELLSDQSPTMLHKPLRERLASAVNDLGTQFAVLASGAMHDAAFMARRVPSALVFVPSRNGISHSPDEHTEIADIARGCEVIATAILAEEHRHA